VRNIFAAFRAWPKTLSDFMFCEARFLGFDERRSARPQSIVSGQAGNILLQVGLSGILTRTGLLKGLAVIPGHPSRRILGQLCSVFLQLGEVGEGIGLV
jgi:hypothetical protein